jgi:hypothetical protein
MLFADDTAGCPPMSRPVAVRSPSYGITCWPSHRRPASPAYSRMRSARSQAASPLRPGFAADTRLMTRTCGLIPA